MHTSFDIPSDIQRPAAVRKRGRYSDAFKAQLVAACNEPGVSTAAIALANRLNANLLRRWVSEHRQNQGTGAVANDDRMQLHFSREDLQVGLSFPAHQHSQCATLHKLMLF